MSSKDDGYHGSFLWRIYRKLAETADRSRGWDRLGKPLGLAVLVGLRDALRRYNLHDTSGQPSVNLPPLSDADDVPATARTLDGSYNDLENPRMGMAGSRFGRNVPIEHTWPLSPDRIVDPSPREISRQLMTRERFIAAEPVNSLVAAWLQFMIRDWFSHGKSPKDNPWRIELAEDDPWPARPMTIMRTRPDPTGPDTGNLPPTYANTETHWWDASQIYGTTADYSGMIRTGTDGKLRVRPDGQLPWPTDDAHNPALVPGFWVGLAMMQTLFTREHNAVCDMLRGHFPTWSDEELFQRARLIVAALIAKIHTVEWTPCVIAHPTTITAMRANWFGLQGERLQRLWGRLTGSEVVSGIPGSATQHFGVPYAITEEFVAVYRMHPMIRDDWSIRSHADDHLLREHTFRDLAGPKTLSVMETYGMPDLLYSFGTLPPGLVTLHNFPRFLQEFERPDGYLQDLAATDILRQRELGVPRYNEFRRLLRLAPAKTFTQLTDDPETAERMERIYGDVESVDLLVGMFAERRPEGFAFSDTAFRIFILMASRRLNSDRFFTRDFNDQVYTRPGIRWVQDTTMIDVLLRHHPELRPALRGVDNAFKRWVPAAQEQTRP
jgi:hypothetical protein